MKHCVGICVAFVLAASPSFATAEVVFDASLYKLPTGKSHLAKAVVMSLVSRDWKIETLAADHVVASMSEGRVQVRADFGSPPKITYAFEQGKEGKEKWLQYLLESTMLNMTSCVSP